MELPNDATQVALLVAGIGLIGGLVGSMIGFLGGFISTSRQIDRQERNARRELYGKFLDCAVGLTDLREHQDIVQGLVSRQKTEAETFRSQLQQTHIATAADVHESEVHRAERMKNEAKDTRAKAEDLRTRFDTGLNRAHALYHHLVVIAPKKMIDAGEKVLQAVIEREQAKSDNERATTRLALIKTLTNFAILARSDGRAPESPSFEETAKRIERLRSGEFVSSSSEGQVPT